MGMFDPDFSDHPQERMGANSTRGPFRTPVYRLLTLSETKRSRVS
jgi:hypothetical protein